MIASGLFRSAAMVRHAYDQIDQARSILKRTG